MMAARCNIPQQVSYTHLLEIYRGHIYPVNNNKVDYVIWYYMY